MEVEVQDKSYSLVNARLAFEKEFMPHLDAMYNFALKLTADEDDAQDLVQDTCLKAYRFINSFEPGTYAKAWLFRILKNNLDAHDKNDEVNYPVLAKELRLQRARYLAAMRLYLPLIRCSSHTPQSLHH